MQLAVTSVINIETTQGEKSQCDAASMTTTCKRVVKHTVSHIARRHCKLHCKLHSELHRKEELPVERVVNMPRAAQAMPNM